MKETKFKDMRSDSENKYDSKHSLGLQSLENLAFQRDWQLAAILDHTAHLVHLEPVAQLGGGGVYGGIFVILSFNVIF